MLTPIKACLLIALTIIVLFFLTDKKYSTKKLLFILSTSSIALFLTNFLLFYSYNKDYDKLHLFVNYSFVYVLFLFLSKQKGFKYLFSFLTAFFFMTIIASVGLLISIPFQCSIVANMIGCLIAFVPLLILIRKVLTPLFKEMRSKLNHGWWLFCMILTLYSLRFLIDYNFLMKNFNTGRTINLILSVIIMTGGYSIICLLFSHSKKHYELMNEQNLLKIQVQSLENQFDAVQKSIEVTNIYRHDMRHYLHNIAVLLKNGDTQSVLNIIGDLDYKIDQSKPPVYCENSYINTILIYYLDLAKKEGISVSTKLDIPEKLTVVDKTELACVFANAIENAQNACRKLPKGTERILKITSLTKPILAIEIVNSYQGPLQFDSHGLPISSEQGHGFGSQSISAFAKKYDAVLHYQAENGFFKLRILLNKNYNI